MAYDKNQFEAAFQLITAISHQIIKVDFQEVENWVEKIMGPQSLKDEATKINLNNLKTVMQSFVVMNRILREHGVPVRDIQHYRDTQPEPNQGPDGVPLLPAERTSP